MIIVTTHDINVKMDILHGKSKRYKNKELSAKDIISRALVQMDRPYLSFSGGKDSLIMLHMVLEQKPDIPVVYWDADASFPDTDIFLDKISSEWNIDLIRFKTRPILEVFREYGIDHPQIEAKTMIATVYDPIKKLIAEYGFDGVFVGLRREESYGRKQLIKYRGPIFYSKYQNVIECLPVAYFSVQDVWAYITANKLPYNPVYDKTSMRPRNEIRVSYYCGESIRERGRFVWLKKEYPDLYNRFAAEFPEVRWFG